VFERFIARQAILKDNLTLFGYDLRFRAEESGVGEVSRSSAPYLVNTSATVFHWETLTGNAPAFVSLTAAAIPRGNAQPCNHPAG
jgi:c-di-GMP-related signal transduction protein